VRDPFRQRGLAVWILLAGIAWIIAVFLLTRAMPGPGGGSPV